ncbi:hypothetical protein EGCR1_04550 [Enterococcus gilvus]|uniref:hypothetical protein n=1 Tax=Enterococcus gilvus TaxID=160453 RepID=UPI000DF5FCA0|nr:hypothetical protein [Enterococcus gilvus]AXG38014.1 hypothetical protein EGCR1_04550 [Enterococcus gilvus]
MSELTEKIQKEMDVWEDLREYGIFEGVGIAKEIIEEHELQHEIKLNDNQKIVLEWLKDELNDSYFKAAVSNLFFWARYDDVEGFPNERSHKMVQAFEELDDKDFGQVLASFAEWGMKNDK